MDKPSASDLRRSLLKSVETLLDSQSDAEIDHLARTGSIFVTWLRNGARLSTREALDLEVAPDSYAPIAFVVARKANPS